MMRHVFGEKGERMNIAVIAKPLSFAVSKINTTFGQGYCAAQGSRR